MEYREFILEVNLEGVGWLLKNQGSLRLLCFTKPKCRLGWTLSGHASLAEAGIVFFGATRRRSVGGFFYLEEGQSRFQGLTAF